MPKLEQCNASCLMNEGSEGAEHERRICMSTWGQTVTSGKKWWGQPPSASPVPPELTFLQYFIPGLWRCTKGTDPLRNRVLVSCYTLPETTSHSVYTCICQNTSAGRDWLPTSKILLAEWNELGAWKSVVLCSVKLCCQQKPKCSHTTYFEDSNPPACRAIVSGELMETNLS